MTATTPNEILCEAARRKIRLTPDGPRLIATCPGKLPADMEQMLVENKPALLKLLNQKRYIARQVLEGAFDPLEIDGTFACMDGRQFGLICSELVVQYYADPICARAFEYLRAAQKEKNSK